MLPVRSASTRQSASGSSKPPTSSTRRTGLRPQGCSAIDQSACSFTSEGIFDLSNIQVPGTPAGKHLGQMVGFATLWTTSDALRTIEDVQALMANPNDAAAASSLTVENGQLASDRRNALAEEAAADHLLATHLAGVDMPNVTTSTSS